MMSLEDSGSKWFITDIHKLLVKRIRVWNFERIVVLLVWFLLRWLFWFLLLDV